MIAGSVLIVDDEESLRNLLRGAISPEGYAAHVVKFDDIIGQSAAIRDTITIAQKVAALDTTVLLQGETGTGKELFAKAIHGGSRRAGNPFIAFNCSAFGKDLTESELFGKTGLIEEAGGGTLFLDEIGEMPIDLQAKLLRVLETGQFLKVGATLPSRADVRIISATSRNLQAEIGAGRFREDLYYRLNVFTIEIPPLRDREKDIAILARYFIKLFAGKMNKTVVGMSREFLSLLKRQSWKGNIRELKNVIERAVILAEGTELGTENLPAELRLDNSRSPALPAFDLASVERQHIQRVLNHTNGNKAEAARLLNIGLTTVYRKMEEYGLN